MVSMVSYRNTGAVGASAEAEEPAEEAQVEAMGQSQQGTLRVVRAGGSETAVMVGRAVALREIAATAVEGAEAAI